MSDYFANKTIVLPFDFSDESKSAIEDALTMAHATTRLCALHVMLPLNFYITPVEPGTILDWGSDEERAKRTLAKMKEQIHFPHHQIECAIKVGDPGLKIVDYAKKIGADIIVIPSHGQTGVKRMLLGSVSERVARHAECPVMILRKPPER